MNGIYFMKQDQKISMCNYYIDYIDNNFNKKKKYLQAIWTFSSPFLQNTDECIYE